MVLHVLPEKHPESPGRVRLHVVGQRFSPGSKVLFYKAPLETAFVGGRRLMGTMGLPSTGEHEVSVTLPDGVSSAPFTFSFARRPRIDGTSFASTGIPCGKETLVVWGANFWIGAALSLLTTDGSKEYRPESK